ncbi:type II toxin-antitoxin system PemK/MazF family toxin [Aminomonas paucivorans]|uniref:type II toxin-antitoxin system PemK/MazF family toxin n=1 Tax=Aminomonas paucivorans TaxID=81412 RepID=UPI00331CF38A
MGSEIRKTRPVVIVSNDSANRHLAQVVVPLTSRTSRLYPGEALVTVSGRSAKAAACQIMTADQARPKSLLGVLSKADLILLEEAIQIHLALPR